MRNDVPFPPQELAVRVGAGGVEPARYEELGRISRAEILAALPEGWTFSGKRVLDFGCGAGRTLRHFLDEAHVGELYGCDIDEPSIDWLRRHLSPPLTVFVNGETPPLPLEDDSFDLIWAISVFTHLVDHWADWLVELHRVLRDGALLIATILGPGWSEDRGPVPAGARARGSASSTAEADRVGMNVIHYGHPWEQGGPTVFHSGWWIEEHWGRAFEIATLRDEGSAGRPPDIPGRQGLVVARKRPVEITVEEVERIDPTEWREIEALRHNVRQLHRETETLYEDRRRMERERDALRGRSSAEGSHAR